MTPFLLTSHILQGIIAAFIFWLGLLVYGRNKQSHTHIGFFVLAVCSAAWLGFYLLAYVLSAHNLLLFKCGFSFVIFTGIGAYHFSTSYVNLRNEIVVIKALYIVGAIFLYLLWTGNFLIDNTLLSYRWGTYPRAGILHPAVILFFTLIMIRLNVLLYKKYSSAKHQKDEKEILRTRYVLISAIFFSLAGIDFLPNYGIHLFMPMGHMLAAVYSGLMAYSILRHQLLDIEVIIKRTAVFAGLFAFTYGIFTTITIGGQEFFRNSLQWNQWIAMIPTVLIIMFALRPLENFLTEVTERFLFQKKYDYRVLLKTFTNEVLTVLDLQKLTEQTIVGLNKIIKLESASMLLFDKDSKTYKIAASSGLKDKNIFFTQDDAIATYLNKTHQAILKDKSVERMEGYSILRDNFRKLNAQLCLPIAHHDEVVGILSLGIKKSGEEFTLEDIDILMTLARTLAIAIANAQLFDQLSKTQAEAAQREKMAVIGTLAAGINHEICNPLGIVRGQCEMYLLNLRDGLYNNKTREDMNQIASEIMNKVIKETDRATAITKKLSGFAKPAKKVDNEEVNVEKEADEVLGLIGHDLRLNNIEFKKDFPLNFPPILADRRQIQEVLFNIIRNAAQAMEKEKKDGWIGLSGSIQGAAAVIKIADNGSGIPQDKIGQIFNPFFTTKEPGKGTGLGLFIVKQVIERNHGTIQVDSQEGVGTTFTLTFPVAVAAQAKVLAA